MSLALGGYGAIAGARAAAATQKTMMPTPISAGLDSRILPSRRAHARASPPRTLSGTTGTPSAVAGMDTRPSGSDAWGEEHVGEIAEDLRQDRHAPGHHRTHLHQRAAPEHHRPPNP